MTRIFISYRRDSCSDICAHLREKIEERFGSGSVFLDTVSLVAGEDFPCRLREEIARCSALLVVMDKDWASLPSAGGGRRLDDPNDFVRQEIETAIRLNRRVIPVQVHGAKFPPAEELPDSVKPFTRCHAVKIHEEPLFRESVKHLLDQLAPKRSWKLLSWAVALIVLAFVGVGVALASGLIPIPERNRETVHQPVPAPGGEPVKIPAENPVIVPGPSPYTPATIGGFTVNLPAELARAKPEKPFPLAQAPGAVRGIGWLVVLSRKAGLPSGPWFVQDVLAFGSNEPIQFRNWHPAGVTEEVCLLLCDDLSKLRDIDGKSGVVAVPPAGKVAAPVVASFALDRRSATHIVRVSGR